LDRLEDIAAPTLVLVGGDDEEAIRAQGVLLERRMADARQITVPDGGHLLNLTSPAAFQEAVTEFLGLPRN
jgi:pimeloyl-ACP methyl ester carboxylesterase